LKFRRLVVAATLAAVAVLVVMVATANSATIDAATTDNLIANGDAEANGPGGKGGKVNVAPWVRNGFGVTPIGCDGPGTGATAVRYGSPKGFPDYGDPGPADRGTNFFAGGHDCGAHVSYLLQCLDITPHTPTVDHPVTWNADVFLGGFDNQADRAAVVLVFEDNAGCNPGKKGKHVLGEAQIGPVTETDRAGITGLLERTGSGDVPHGTYGILVADVFQAFNGTYNDGYLDNESLTLTVHTVTG
jgi:hypothetical protein